MPENINAEDSKSNEVQDVVTNANTTEITTGKSKSKKPAIIAVVFAVCMIVLGIGAAAYTSLVLNDPDRIWEQALQNTSDGFTELSQNLQETPYVGGTLDGRLEITSPIAATGTINGAWYEKNAKINGTANISGIETSGEIRVVGETDVNKRNIYIKLDGLDNASAFLSLVQPSLAEVVTAINDKWLVVDETFMQEDSSSVGEMNKPVDVSPEKLTKMSTNISAILNDRLFTADSSKAVIVADEAIGREDFEGDDSYKYKVKIQKQQYADFIHALKDSLKQTELQDTLMQDISGVPEVESFTDILDKIDEIDFDKFQAEAWVDMENKYFRNIRIPVKDDNAGLNGYIDFGLNYEGGNEYPFNVRFVSDTNTEGSNEVVDALFEASFNKETTALGLGFTIAATQDGSQINVTSSLILKPSDETVEVEVPENAQSISELLGLFMNQDAFMSTFEKFETDDSSYQLDDVEL